MEKLSGAGLLAILLCARCFTALTSFTYNCLPAAYMAGAAVSAAVQCLLLVPAVVICKRGSFSPAQSKAAALCYLLFFMYESFLDMGNFRYYIKVFFTSGISDLTAVICCVLTAVYLASVYTRDLAKTAEYAAAGILLLLVMIFMGAQSRIDINNLDLAAADFGAQTAASAVYELSRCDCLVLLVFLLPQLRSRQGALSFGFVALKTLLLESGLMAVTLVLGSFAQVTHIPFFNIAAYSSSGVRERGDAVFLFVWVFTGVVRLAVLLHCSSKCLKRFVPKLGGVTGAAAAAVIPFTGAMIFTRLRGWDGMANSSRSVIPMILLIALLPVAGAVFSGKEGHYATGAVKES